MDKILHYFKYPKLRELWYIPYYGSCRILSINRSNNNSTSNDNSNSNRNSNSNSGNKISNNKNRERVNMYIYTYVCNTEKRDLCKNPMHPVTPQNPRRTQSPIEPFAEEKKKEICTP